MNAAVPGTQGYGSNAAAIAEMYESLSFIEVHSDLLKFLPNSSSRVLDVGSGSGRDAAALAQLGHKVTAVEPTHELLLLARQRHASLPIDWVNDHLPNLLAMKEIGFQFDLILLSAVWIHLSKEERTQAMKTIAELVTCDGQVFITLRHGVLPNDRRMFDVTVEETLDLASTNGFTCQQCNKRSDVSGRQDVWWSSLVLKHTKLKSPV